MLVTTVALWIHILTMVFVLGGYIFLTVFWWPVLRQTVDDARMQARLFGQTIRRFFPMVVLALTLEVLTGGLYLLPPAYRVFGAGDEAALAGFHLVLTIKLAAAFLVLLLVPMQLFGMGTRITRMDAGVYAFDAALFGRLVRRLQMTSYLIIALLTLVVILSTRL